MFIYCHHRCISDEQGDTEYKCKRVSKSVNKLFVTLSSLSSSYKCDNSQHATIKA